VAGRSGRYYYGFGGGGSPVAQQLNILGAQLRGGLGDIAQDRVTGAKLRLEERLLGHRLGREAEQDRRFTEYEQPKLELEAEKAKAETEFRKQPFIPPTSLFRGTQPTIDEAMHVAGHPTREIKEIFGYKTKTNPDGSINRLERKLPDGSTKILTEGIVADNPQVLKTILMGWTRPDRAIAGQREKLAKFKEKNPDHPEMAKIDAALKDLDAIEKDPKRMLKRWRGQEQQQIELIKQRESRGLPITHNEKELKYIRDEIKYLRGEPDRELERKKTRAQIKKLGREPKTPKTLQQIEDEAAARARGTASVTKPPKPVDPDVKAKRQRDKMADLRALEITITSGKDSKGNELTAEDLQIEVRDWNRLSDENYVYVYAPGEKRSRLGLDFLATDISSEMEKVPLPEGMTAKKVQHTADKYNMDIREVLKRLKVITEAKTIEGET
jgi:hypothetical protein